MDSRNHHLLQNVMIRKNILVTIETNTDHVFGAYTSTGWKGNNPSALRETADHKAFVFFIRHPDSKKQPQIYNADTNKDIQIASFNGYFCYFGMTFWLCNNCNEEKRNGFITGLSCAFQGIDHGYIGSLNTSYLVKEIEVFQLE